MDENTELKLKKVIGSSLENVIQDFVFIMDEENDLPCWLIEADESWVTGAARELYDAIVDHPLSYINKNIFDKDDFAATMSLGSFEKMNFTTGNGGKEATRFRDIGFILVDEMRRMMKPAFPMRMYITFSSKTTDNFVNAMFQFETQIIVFGANLKDHESFFRNLPDVGVIGKFTNLEDKIDEEAEERKKWEEDHSL